MGEAKFTTFRRQPRSWPDPVCVSCTPPGRDGNLIFFTAHWKVLLHPNQCSPGNVLVVSRRHAPKVSALTREEAMDFHRVLRHLEPALETALGATMINLSCDRNWAYRERDPDPPFHDGRPCPHVHWHVVPRFRAPVRFGGLRWVDPTFGEPFRWRHRTVPDNVRRALIHAIRRPLPIKYVALN